MTEIDIRINKIINVLNGEGDNLSKFKSINEIIQEKKSADSSGKTIVDKKDLVEWIKDLSKRGYSFESISKITCTSLHTVRFYLVDGYKEKSDQHNKVMRDKMKNNPEAYQKYLEYQKLYQKRKAQKKRAEDRALLAVTGQDFDIQNATDSD